MSLKVVVNLDSQPSLKLDDKGFVKNLKLITTVTNTSDQLLTLINDPSCVLCPDQKLKFQKFNVKSTSEDVTSPQFRGIHVTFSPEKAVELANVISLEPFIENTRIHDLSTTYKFISGQGEYTFEPKNIFYAVNSATRQIEIIKAEVEPFSARISREGVWPVAPSVPEEQPEAGTPIPISVYEKSEKRASDSVRYEIVAPEAQIYSIQHAPTVRIPHDVVAVPIGSSEGAEDYAAVDDAPEAEENVDEEAKLDEGEEPLVTDDGPETADVGPQFSNIDDFERQIELISATQSVEECIDEAIRYLANMGDDSDRGTLRYDMWFGKYDKERKKVVQEQFEIMRNSFKSFVYATAPQSFGDIFAYGYQDDEKQTLYLCQIFWDAPLIGFDSKVDVIISEFSHFAGDITLATAWGVQACKDLAAMDPNQAVMNPESYAFFAVNRPWHE